LENSELSQLRAVIEGRVQGVGFRYFVQQAAIEIGITGWVRNLADGRVELLVEGSRQDCDELLKTVSQGPSMSAVSNVDEIWGNPTGEERGFHIKPTAKNSS
jgi:acylphosphatase